MEHLLWIISVVLFGCYCVRWVARKYDEAIRIMVNRLRIQNRKDLSG